MVYVPPAPLAAALAGNHRMSCRVTVINQDSGAVADVPISDGKVSATLANRITRSIDLTVDRRVTAGGLLNPLRDLVIVRTGVTAVGEVPLFTGRVVSRSDNGAGEVTVHALDRGHDISKAEFEQPWVSLGGPGRDEIVRIITDLNTGWGVDISRAPDTKVPAGLVWDDDRGKALDEVAAGISCLLQGDRSGGFLLYPNPFSLSATDEVDITARIVDGEGGALVDVSHTESGEQVYNAVTVVVDRTDQSRPIRVTVRDTGPQSLTRWDGPFGRRNRVVHINIPITVEEATLLATRILNQSLALARSWQLTLPHSPLHDPGDVVAVVYRGELTVQVVESVQHNLKAKDTTQLASRQLHQIDVDIT